MTMDRAVGPPAEQAYAEGLPQGYREGIITAIAVLLGFSLTFLRYWGLEAPGEWHPGSIVAAILITASIMMQIFALWRSLRLADNNPRQYGRTLNFFVISAVLLAVSLFIATLTFSGVFGGPPPGIVL
ncbi:MAG: hypothetical protein AB7H90_04450 [Alphaproteobacteria bacterium]